MLIRPWLRSKRTLIADRNALEAIVAKQVDEIADKDGHVADLQESLRLAHRAMNTQRRLRVEADERLAAVVAELKALREEIRQAEGNLPSAAGVGMVRPVQLRPAPPRSPLSARLQSRPLPADLTDDSGCICATMNNPPCTWCENNGGDM